MKDISHIDYTNVEIFDKRPYDEYPYLVLPTDVFRISLTYDIDFPIRAFVYRKSELFGDPCPQNLAGVTISFNIYNSDNVLVCVGKGDVSDLDTSEITYELKELDIAEPGRYFGYFIITDLDGKSMMLPNPRTAQRLILNVI